LKITISTTKFNNIEPVQNVNNGLVNMTDSFNMYFGRSLEWSYFIDRNFLVPLAITLYADSLHRSSYKYPSILYKLSFYLTLYPSLL